MNQQASSKETLEQIIARAKSKTPCASNYECLLADLMGLAQPSPRAGRTTFAKLLELQIRIQHSFEEREPSSGAWSEPFRVVCEVFKAVLPLKDDALAAATAERTSKEQANEKTE